MTTTVVETNLDRKLTLVDSGFNSGSLVSNLRVEDTGIEKVIYTSLNREESLKLGKALIGTRGIVVEGELPTITRDSDGWLHDRNYGSYESVNPEETRKKALALLAIAAKQEEFQEAKKLEEAEKAKAEEVLQERRDNHALALAGWSYHNVATPIKSAVNQIIALEDKLEAK